MNKNLKFVLLGAVICAFIFSALFFSGYNPGLTAQSKMIWLTMNADELKHLDETARAKGSEFNFQIKNVQNDIAVVEFEESQTGQLSSLMHDEYNRCAGFIAHDSQDEAEQYRAESFAADASQQLLTYTIDNQPTVNAMIADTQETNIRQTMIDLSAFPNRRHNQPTGLTSAAWIKDKWTAMAQGRSDITVSNYSHTAGSPATPQPSIVLTIQGTTLPNEIVVIGAHQDSINLNSQTGNAPGADDDASGIACLTETLRLIVAKNFHPQRTVQLMAYAAEEVGLYGSKNIANDYRAANKNVIGVMQLDMTNFKGSAAYDIVIFTDYTNAAQNQFVRDLITTYQPTLSIGTSVCGYACSDHASWYNKSYPTSMPYEALFNDDNHQIHTTGDTMAYMNNSAAHSVKFAKLATSFVGELAKGNIIFVDNFPQKYDYDGDGKADISVFRPDGGTWYLQQSTAGFAGAAFGQSGDQIVPADYDGDRKTDLAVYRGGTWYLNRSSAGFTGFAFGQAGDIPVQADYDGDGKADAAVFRPSEGAWYILKSSGGMQTAQFGLASDQPIAADYDGDGKADIAVFRDGYWYILKSSTGFSAVQFGQAGDVPARGDFDGDGKSDLAIFRAGIWYLQKSTAGFSAAQFGAANDKPVPADYDGDGKADIAVFRQGAWYILRSSNAAVTAAQFGLSNDVPTPQLY